MYTHIRTYVRTYIKAYIRTFIHLHVLAYKLTSKHTYIQAYMCTYKHGYIYTSIHAYVIYTFDLYEHPIQSLKTESSTFQRTSTTTNPVPLHSTWHTLLQYRRYTSAFATASQGCCHVIVGITQHILLARAMGPENCLFYDCATFLRTTTVKAPHALLLRNNT